MAPPSTDGYLRFPSIGADVMVFITEDDLWAVPTEGGAARRLTADLLGISRPVLSPDGESVAFTADAQGQPDIYVVPSTGGPARRLTWLGTASGRTGAGGQTKVLAWSPEGQVVFATDAGQPFASLTMAHAIGPGGEQPPRVLPYGPVRDLSYGPRGAVVIGRNTGDPALWKRYRGGTAGSVWIDRHGNGEFKLLLRSADVDGNIGSPMWLGERIYFLSDHQGIGNLYSCSLTGDDIRRHTDHPEHYARNASTDGRSVVYQVAAEIWRFDVATGLTAQVEVRLGSPRTQRQPRFVAAGPNLGAYRLDRSGKTMVLDARGKLFSMAPFDGPVVQHGQPQGARYRLAHFLGDSTQIVVVSDSRGWDGIEVHLAEGAGVEGAGAPVRYLATPGLGRPVEVVPSPDGSLLAVTDHENRLFLVNTADGETLLLDESRFGPVSQPAWSPDSNWVAYSYRSSPQTSQIRLASVAEGLAHAVTAPEFIDYCPCFDPSGKYLYFLSKRTFDPVYDSLFLDLNFPLASRPYLVTLQSDLPSPFIAPPAPPTTGPGKAGEGDGKAGEGDGKAGEGDGASQEVAASAGRAGEQGQPVAPVRVDLEGIGQRVLELPVPEARYEAVLALRDKALLLSRPQQGALHADWTATAPPTNGTLECFDLVEGRKETFAEEVADMTLSGDGSHLAYRTSGPGDERRLRLVPTAGKPDAEAAKEGPGRRSGFVDLGRVRPRVDPGAEWAQMVKEAWRLQAQHFWVPDLSGVDWDLVLQRYLPLVERAATRTEVSDLIWEIQGELGTSHCYEMGGEYRKPPGWAQGHLGADLARDADGNWVIARALTGSSWQADEASPLLAPGALVGPGTVVLAVNGQPVAPATGPAPLLANQAGQVVELTVSGPEDGAARDGRRARKVVVRTLANERPLRYRDWVTANRALVRQGTDGRAGYLHVPDMMPRGWAEFHRSYLAEVEREALVVDVRFNGGGHISALVLEKLARRVIGWAVPRRGAPEPYPAEAPRGPLVAITNEWAGSDGDIFTHGFKLLKLGPVIGTRTWGGVIGIDPFQPLVDGTLTTQPHIAFWFQDVGWGVENYGTDPHEEVLFPPQDYAAGKDPQLARAIELVNEALGQRRAPGPNTEDRARRRLPVLPPR